MLWKHSSLLLITILLCLFPINHSANILCMFTSCVQQNLIVFMAVANTLIDKGHNVTIVTTIPIPTQVAPKSNFRHVYLENPIEKIRKLKAVHIISYNETAPSTDASTNFFIASHMLTYMQKDALQQKEFQEFFHEDNSFDLMIMGYYYNDFMVGIGARYQCPIAIVSLCAPFSTLSRWIGNPSTTSYVQEAFFGKSQPMSFIERYQNFFINAIEPLAQMYTEFVMGSIYR
ncbi:UDP-glycosyltransferase UGT4-like isoform X7 [Episyrphus balteatus]|nr:UDP-glycosyltransferase UGT4-like isoform X7 [Episyrphus balteatus]